MAATSFLELYNQRADALKFGRDIRLDIKSKPLIDFRITYSNPDCHISRKDGVGVATGSLKSFVDEMYGQLSDNGYIIEPCIGPFSKDCAYIYLNKKDIQKEYPRLKVYVHPNELAGWAPSTHVKKLLKIAEENSLISNVRLVFSQKVYNISNEEYLNILREAEPQIKDWLIEYKKHCGRRRGTPGETFDQIFGIRRLSVAHRSFRDYVAINFINTLL